MSGAAGAASAPSPPPAAAPASGGSRGGCPGEDVPEGTPGDRGAAGGRPPRKKTCRTRSPQEAAPAPAGAAPDAPAKRRRRPRNAGDRAARAAGVAGSAAAPAAAAPEGPAGGDLAGESWDGPAAPRRAGEAAGSPPASPGGGNGDGDCGGTAYADSGDPPPFDAKLLRPTTFEVRRLHAQVRCFQRVLESGYRRDSAAAQEAADGVKALAEETRAALRLRKAEAAKLAALHQKVEGVSVNLADLGERFREAERERREQLARLERSLLLIKQEAVTPSALKDAILDSVVWPLSDALDEHKASLSAALETIQEQQRTRDSMRCPSLLKDMMIESVVRPLSEVLNEQKAVFSAALESIQEQQRSRDSMQCPQCLSREALRSQPTLLTPDVSGTDADLQTESLVNLHVDPETPCAQYVQADVKGPEDAERENRARPPGTTNPPRRRIPLPSSSPIDEEDGGATAEYLGLSELPGLQCDRAPATIPPPAGVSAAAQPPGKLPPPGLRRAPRPRRTLALPAEAPPKNGTGRPPPGTGGARDLSDPFEEEPSPPTSKRPPASTPARARGTSPPERGGERRPKPGNAEPSCAFSAAAANPTPEAGPPAAGPARTLDGGTRGARRSSPGYSRRAEPQTRPEPRKRFILLDSPPRKDIAGDRRRPAAHGVFRRAIFTVRGAGAETPATTD